MILTANSRTYTWFPKKLVCSVAVLSDFHAMPVYDKGILAVLWFQ